MRNTRFDYQTCVCQAMNYISQNIERELSLAEISDSASLSRFHFHRIFKAVSGETVAEFTRRLRLELAANRLLSHPREDITSISLGCGFSSSQNFAKAFRQQFGVTPSAYRIRKIGNIRRNIENEFSLNIPYDRVSYPTSTDPERRDPIHVEIQELPEQPVAYVRKLGAYSKETCAPAFMTLMQWAAPRNYIRPGAVLGIYWDNPEITPPERCRFDACVAIPRGAAPEGLVHTQTLRGGPYAVCHFQRRSEDVQSAWDEAFRWLCASGYECADLPCFERYNNLAAEHPEGLWIFDICIPLRDDCA